MKPSKRQATGFHPPARRTARSVALAACGLFLCTLPAYAQDIHFSQFFNTPYAQNPANIGRFEGDYRMGAIYRQQWRSVTVPYSTFGMGGDAASFLGVGGLGLGLWMYNDRAGTSRLTTFHAGLGASWSQPLDAAGEHHLTAGAQCGFSNTSIDYNALRFDAQYNGFSYDPSLGTGEPFPRDARSRLDLHAGIGYRYTPEKRRQFTAGLAFFNLTTPDVSLFNAAPSPLDLRTVLHAGAQFPVSGTVDVLPLLQWQDQGTFREFLLGGTARYILLDRWGLMRAVQGGLLMRAKDAGYLYAGLEHDDWTFGLSYDINLSRLEPASRNRGGFEVTATKVFRKRPPVPVRYKACPDQL
ncbi:MAG: PorP/SprF family type IX secretion system membrane protein [Flavobacteriales bacterium]|nr:PorP/SprF family type IX secretion system membrane protein [Flavobacteriales bacterium]MBP9080652.1 PorP/SprF family type IX secretion system membrane protein [Flavobacteriales bacterium]